MSTCAEGCGPAELVRGGEIEVAGSRSLCLVPGVIAKLYITVKILFGHKAYSTQSSVGRHQKRFAGTPGSSKRREVCPIQAAVERILPGAGLQATGRVDRNAFLCTGIDIAGGSGERENGCPIGQTIVLILPGHRRRLDAGHPPRCIVYGTHCQSGVMNAIAEGCDPAEFVRGRDIENAASPTLCLVPCVIAELHGAVKILVGYKAYSTQSAVGRQHPCVTACCRWHGAP